MERKIGEIFIDGRLKLKVVACNDGVYCAKCVYTTPRGKCARNATVTGPCHGLFRTDHTEVRFEPIID